MTLVIASITIWQLPCAASGAGQISVSPNVNPTFAHSDLIRFASIKPGSSLFLCKHRLCKTEAMPLSSVEPTGVDAFTWAPTSTGSKRVAFGTSQATSLRGRIGGPIPVCFAHEKLVRYFVHEGLLRFVVRERN